MKQNFSLIFLVLSMSMYSQICPDIKEGEFCCHVILTPENFYFNNTHSDLSFWKIFSEEEKNLLSEQDTKEEFKQYEYLLKELGYITKIRGKVDEEFIKAHNKYIKAQQKNNKIRRKLLDNF